MSRERSYFEHNGMPLQAAANAGRVRHTQEPWLGSFTAHRAQPAEQQRSGTGGVVMPEPSNEVIGMNDEAGQSPASEMPAAPSLLQRAATGTAGVPPTSVTQSINQQQPQFTSAAQPNEPNTGISAPMGQPGIPVNVRHAEPAHGTEIKTAGEPEGASANLVTGGAGLPGDVSDSAPSLPRVLVQKHFTIQTEISSVSAAGEPATMSLPDGALSPLVAAMGSPISMAGAAGTETGETLMSSESFSAAAILPPAVPVREARLVHMGSGNLPNENIKPLAMPESQPQSGRSQKALLDRLNDRAAPQQQERGGRRVHIGNLRITVQRPAIAGAPAPASAPSAQPQAAAAGQTLFNPWERHYMAFD